MYGWIVAAGLLSFACGDDGRTNGSAGATNPTGASGLTGVTGVTGVTGEATTGSGSDSASGGSTAAPTTGGGPCTEDTDCPQGQHCGEWSGECLPEGGCVYTEDCPGGQVCTDGKCVIGGDCGSQAFELTKVPPNVMIVLDRSGSMDGDVMDSNKNRWEVAKDAIFQLVGAFNNEIRFGLVTYSACILFDECSAGEIVVPLGNLAAGPIQGFLINKGNEYLCNTGAPETSTGNTLRALVGEPSLQDPERNNAVLLITDGNENEECQGDTNAAAAAGSLFAQAISVRTFAVGFADGILGSLADVATNGGTTPTTRPRSRLRSTRSPARWCRARSSSTRCRTTRASSTCSSTT